MGKDGSLKALLEDPRGEKRYLRMPATPGHTPRAAARIAPGAARGAGAPAGEGLTSTHSAIIE
jgi:hypothetical protein